MKKWFLLLLIPFFFSGCVTFTAKYQPEYISSNINPYLNKVETVNICVKNNSNIISRNPKSVSGALATLNIPVGEISTKVSQDFFRQYFNQTGACKYYSNFEVLDYTVAFGEFSDGSEIYVKVHYTFSDGNTILLDKVYESKSDNNVVLRPLALHKSESAFELFHKIVLDMLETQIKPDILNAL